MISLGNYFIVHALVIGTLSLIILGLSWIFMQYAVKPLPISFLRLTQGIGTTALAIFAAVVINKFYPLSLFKIVVPAFLCAVVVHSTIIIFSLHVQYIAQQTVSTFPKFLALCLNYAFFAIVSGVMIYYNNIVLDIFFYYITEASIKIGVLINLYLLLKIKACEVSGNCMSKEVTYNQPDFFDNSENRV